MWSTRAPVRRRGGARGSRRAGCRARATDSPPAGARAPCSAPAAPNGRRPARARDVAVAERRGRGGIGVGVRNVNVDTKSSTEMRFAPPSRTARRICLDWHVRLAFTQIRVRRREQSRAVSCTHHEVLANDQTRTCRPLRKWSAASPLPGSSLGPQSAIEASRTSELWVDERLVRLCE